MRLSRFLSLGFAMTLCTISAASASNSGINAVAVDSNGVTLPSEASGLSDNGRYVLWQPSHNSYNYPYPTTTGFDPEYPNTPYALYRTDTVTGSHKNVNVNSNGETGNTGIQGGASVMSGDGRYVVFLSHATNLDPMDTNTTNNRDIFRHDTVTGDTSIINIGHNGTVTDDGYTYLSGLSRSGRYLLFTSTSSQLVANDNNNRSDIFIADLLQGDIKRVNGGISGGSMSSNGQFILFLAYGNLTNVEDPSLDRSYNLYIHDQLMDTTELLYGADDEIATHFGRQCSMSSRGRNISADGQYVLIGCPGAYVSGRAPEAIDIRLDRFTGEYKVLQRMEDGELTHLGIKPSDISDDGRYVLVHIGENVVGQWPTRTGVHIMDMETDTIQEIFASVTAPGTLTRARKLSGDGRYATFQRGNSSYRNRFTVYHFDSLNQSCSL